MNPSTRLVDVALPLPLPGTFTYSIPEELAEQAEFGRRALIPFRSKIRAGFIVDVNPTHTTGLSDTEIKAVHHIPEEPPYLTENLWKFICWVADYYLLPRGLVLKTALPPGSDRKSKPWALLTAEGRQRLSDGTDDTGRKWPAKLLRSGAVPRRDLETAVGADTVKNALKQGWIAIEERIARPRASLRKKDLPGLLAPAGTGSESGDTAPELTQAQAEACEAISAALSEETFRPFLLYGVTGSGKTEVYLRAIEETLHRSKRALVLVPEIALTPQLARRFLRRFGAGISLFHSGLTGAQRLDEWRRMRSGHVNIVIGARSGIFAPLENLGLIVVDEEHDPSYKQEDSCPYNARDMALARGKLEGACVILGSATPSFESFVNAQRGKLTRLDLPGRHHGGGLPRVEILDLKTTDRPSNKASFFTVPLLDAIQEALGRNDQVVLFLNRRGFDTFVQCRSCGTVLKCPNCDVSLTHHKQAGDVRCHLCGFSRLSPPLCPECSGTTLFFGGSGTQKIEEELRGFFPDARIERLDRDTTRRREDLEGILDRFRNREIDILTGTQMIVKGHDFPGIALVGVLCGDLSLHFPDFRASERTFQMITQVAGRTGRETDSGLVILQTFDPEHEAIRLSSVHDFEGFFQQDSEVRQELTYPPFGHLILIRVEGNNEKIVEKKTVQLSRAARLIKGDSRDVTVLGPAPATRKKVVGKYRWQILLKGADRNPLRHIVLKLRDDGLLKARGLKIVVDVDPVDMM